MTKASRFKRNKNEPGMSHMVNSLKESSKRDFIHNSFTKKEGAQSNIQRTNGLFSYPPLEILGNNMAASTSTETSTSTTDYMYALDGDVETEEPYGQNYSDVNTAKNFNRDKWPRRMEFLLMLVGYTVGLGNVWRFPYLCHKNGGATFLIPYAIFLVAEGIPLYYMELTLGQRLRQGSLGVWHVVSPYLDGLGIASVCVCILVCIYYNVILAWCLVYFVNSFKSPLPWSTCPEEKVLEGNKTVMKEIEECSKAGASKYFWYRTTLNISQGIEHGSQINWTLALTLLITWIIVWLFMIRGIRTEGKVVYVTSTLPILLLAVMFFRGVHLPGFQEGLALLFIPDFTRLKDPLVWLDAASQTFFSLGIAYGSLIAFASYNPLKNDTTRDAIIVCLIDTGVSVYASVVMFCFIGYRAHKKMINCLESGGKIASTDHQLYNMISEGITTTVYPTGNTTGFNTTDKLCNKDQFLGELSQSTELAFITFTEAIDTLPFPNMWSIFFYLMLFLLGIDTQCGMLQGLLTPLLDSKLYPKLRIEVITGCMCLSIFVASLTMTLHSGHYWYQIISNYSASIPLLIIALVQCVALSYIYGMEKFLSDIEYMTNRRPRQIWIICWKFVSPIMIVVVLVFSVYSLAITPPTYQVWDSKSGTAKSMALPPWAHVQFKALAILRLLVQGHDDLANKLLVDKVLMQKVCELSETTAVSTVPSEAQRLIAALLKYSNSSDSIQIALLCGALKPVSSLLGSDHPLMQNEGLIGLIMTLANVDDCLPHITAAECPSKVAKLLKEDGTQAQTLFNGLTFLQALSSLDGGKALLESHQVKDILEKIKNHSDEIVRNKAIETFDLLGFVSEPAGES